MSETKKLGRWPIVTGTVATCVIIFAFLYKHTVDSYDRIIQAKDATIQSLEGENKRLSEHGPVPEAVRKLQAQIDDLQNQLRPLLLVTHVDPITGRCDMGMMSFGTELTTDLIEAQNLLKEKKYDLALAKAEDMQSKLPDFVGSTYIRFKVSQAKGYKDEAAKYAQQLIQELPEDKRIKDVYLFIINHFLSLDQKKEAEDLAVKALALWPDDKELSQSFERIFGYQPSSTKSISTEDKDG